MDVVTQILKYIKRTFDYGIHFWHGENGAFQGYVDIDWAGDCEHRRSMFSFIFTLGTSPISWSANRQSLMETSSTKAQYRMMIKTTKKTMWLRYMLIELQLFKYINSIKLLCDNQSNIKLANNHVFHYRTKHV